MTPEQLKKIAREARNDAVAHKSGWPVANPYATGSAEAKVWQERFQSALKGGA